MQKLNVIENEPVLLDVSGTQMTVGRSTLTKIQNSKLAKMFMDQQNGIKAGKKDEGRIFLDRNPVIFRYIIDYLQSDLKFLP